MHKRNDSGAGFTIVELLIVIVVIAILATISIVAYTGVQTRARDAVRQQDIAQIRKALELYYADNGEYPSSQNGGSVINPSWSTTADSGWQGFVNSLKPYASNIPSDPISTPGASVVGGTGYNYAYFANMSTYCGLPTGSRQFYILAYRLEGSAQTDTLVGDCSTNPLGPYKPNASSYRVRK